jgi:predicted DNA-binding protein
VPVIRKQIYLGVEEDRQLKAIARQEGKSEAAVIREAIAQRLRDAAARDTAWQQLQQLLRALPADGNLQPLRRAEIYQERLRETA